MRKTDKKMKKPYFECLMTIGSLHRLFLESLKAELGRRRIRNISPLQCLTLYRIGKSSLAGKATLSLPALTSLYDSFVSRTDLIYILKRLLKSGLIIHKYTEPGKGRKVYALSEKGLVLYDKLDILFEEYLQQMEKCGLSIADCKNLVRMTLKLQQACQNIILPQKTAMKER